MIRARLVYEFTDADTRIPITITTTTLEIFETSAAVVEILLQQIIFINTFHLCAFTIEGTSSGIHGSYVQIFINVGSFRPGKI